MEIIAATDGSSLGNPGPAGWAWYVDENCWAAGGLDESTNNIGELLGVLDLLRQTEPAGGDLRIYSDSQYVINALTKWRFGWKKKGWKKADGKPVANRELMEQLDALMESRRRAGRLVHFEWVRGHNDHPMNEVADDLARTAAEAIQNGREVNAGPGFVVNKSHSGGGQAGQSNTVPAAQVGHESKDHTFTTYNQRGVLVREHRLQVPLNYEDPQGEQITIFARELTTNPAGFDLDQPALIFMQGGPGSGAPRQGNFRDGWIGEVLKTHRVILMDERGTGLSTPLEAYTIAARGSLQNQVAYVKRFRADSMVEDAERLRAVINGSHPWTSLGQSYGGFINTTYLSNHPEGLCGVYFTGGLPGLCSIDDIYKRTYRATAARNEAYFAHHPADREVLRDVLKHVDTHEEYLPSGERLTSRRLRMLGIMLGTRTGFDLLHYVLEGPFIDVGGQRRLSAQFLDAVWRQVSMGATPMYGLLHETIYGGMIPALKGVATDWAAQRLLTDSSIPVGFNPEPDYNSSDPIYLTGEHIYPFLFDEDPALTPMRDLAHRLAEEENWSTLYDPDRLSQNEVPAAAAVYFEDMFVPVDLSLDTANLIGVRTWVTNEYQHDGLRAGGADVIKHLRTLLEEAPK